MTNNLNLLIQMEMKKLIMMNGAIYFPYKKKNVKFFLIINLKLVDIL